MSVTYWEKKENPHFFLTFPRFDFFLRNLLAKDTFCCVVVGDGVVYDLVVVVVIVVTGVVAFLVVWMFVC
jgi:hypothetical protein